MRILKFFQKKNLDIWKKWLINIRQNENLKYKVKTQSEFKLVSRFLRTAAYILPLNMRLSWKQVPKPELKFSENGEMGVFTAYFPKILYSLKTFNKN